jgi:hypothetical protein
MLLHSSCVHVLSPEVGYIFISHDIYRVLKKGLQALREHSIQLNEQEVPVNIDIQKPMPAEILAMFM